MSQGRNRLDDVDVWVTIVALELDQCVVLTRQLAQYGSGQRCHKLVTSRLIGQDGFGDDEGAAVPCHACGRSARTPCGRPRMHIGQRGRSRAFQRSMSSQSAPLTRADVTACAPSWAAPSASLAPGGRSLVAVRRGCALRRLHLDQSLDLEATFEQRSELGRGLDAAPERRCGTVGRRQYVLGFNLAGLGGARVGLNYPRPLGVKKLECHHR